jgi:cysteinyl-tRNA synthetase
MVNTSRNTEAARKAYKKAKKQKRKIRKAEQLMKEGTVTQNKTSDLDTTKQPLKKWHRVTKEDGAKKAVDRPLEVGYGVDEINTLLEQRSKAKAEKNYDVSDKITKTLVRLQIVYNDDKWEWHTRVLKMPKPWV